MRVSEVSGPFLKSLSLCHISPCSRWSDHSGWVSSVCQASWQTLSLLCPQAPGGPLSLCGDPLTNYTCLLLLLFPSSCPGCNFSVFRLPVLPTPNMLAQRLAASELSHPFPTQPDPPCLPASPLLLTPSFFLGWALLPCPLSGSRS